ncbi:reverse transcriptase domain-containing protein [Tanacetum coccineum]
MHTHASNSELVEPLLEPERTLNRRRRRQNRRVPFDQRNNPFKNPRIVYPPILDINHFRHFLVTLENLYTMDDEPMWTVDRVVSLTPGSAITIPETANEFAIKGNHLTLVKGNQFDERTKTDPHKHIHEFLGICNMFKYRDTKNEAARLMMFPLSLTGEAKTWLDELNEGTIETWYELRTAFISRFFPQALFDRLLGEIRAFSQHENESLTDAWLRMKEMLQNCHGHNLSKENIIKIFYHSLSKITQEVLNAAAGGIFLYKTPNQAYQLLEDNVLLKLDWPKNQKTKSSLKKTVAFIDECSSNSNTDIIMARMDALTLKMDARDEEDEEPTPQPKIQNPKPIKETTLPKPYKPKIPYPQCLRKEKMEAQYGKFLDVISVVRINVPLIDVLGGMPNYGKFLKELISNKQKIEQIFAAFLSDKSSAMIQNNVPPKLGDPRSFLILCIFNKTFSCNALVDLGASINLMQYLLYAKLSLKNLKPTKMSVRLADKSFQHPVRIAENMIIEVGKFTIPADFVIPEMEEDSKVPLILGRPFLHTTDAVIRVKQKQLNLGVGTERMIFNIDSAMKHSYSNDDTCFSIDVIDEILEEDLDALLDEGSKILHSIEGTLLEEEIFAEFDEFMAMTANENSDSESDTEDLPFEKITINTDYKIKTSLKEPPTDLELKPLPDILEYVFLEEPYFLPVIISSQLSKEKKNKLISILKKHNQAFDGKQQIFLVFAHHFANTRYNFWMIRNQLSKKQRKLNPNMQEVVKKEIVKLLDTGIIYPIVDSPWVSPIHCVPKKGGITVVTNKNDELVPTRTITGWRVCIDYRKLNEATAKDHFPLPFMDQMLERLVGNKYFCFLDGFFGYFQIPIYHNDQEKTTFTCPFGTYAYRRMPFGLRNAPATFQRCMLAIFHDMIEESVEVFMDDFSVFGNSFDTCLNNLDKMLQHSLRHIFKKQDAKPRLSRWILLLQEFDIEIKDRKGTKNVAANHLSKLENNKTSDDSEVNDSFPRETLMEINTKDEPKLDDALWAFRTAYKTPIGTTPYKLIYGKNCHLPLEIEHRSYWALKNCSPNLIAAGEKRMFQLHELDELRYQAYENSRLYKERTKVWHDRKLRMRKEFKQGNKVLLFHSKYKFKQPKLRSRWLGPYVVKHQYPSGYVELYGKDGKTFIVNGH